MNSVVKMSTGGWNCYTPFSTQSFWRFLELLPYDFWPVSANFSISFLDVLICTSMYNVLDIHTFLRSTKQKSTRLQTHFPPVCIRFKGHRVISSANDALGTGDSFSRSFREYRNGHLGLSKNDGTRWTSAGRWKNTEMGRNWTDPYCFWPWISNLPCSLNTSSEIT